VKFTKDNAIDYLLDADGNDFVLLKKDAMEFIMNNAHDVVTSSDSYSRLDESPSLRQEVMVRVRAKNSLLTYENTMIS
jgi:hypothetical protein